MKAELYENPLYYDIAFGYRDIAGEAAFLDSAIRRYGACNSKSVLDVACGTCAHSVELAKRGYKITALDKSSHMLAFARQRFASEGLAADFYEADMAGFKLDKTSDSAICMGNSMAYLLDDCMILSHLESVAAALKPGGLYVVDMDNHDYWSRRMPEGVLTNKWEASRGNTRVCVNLCKTMLDTKPRKSKIMLSLSVNDAGKEFTIENEDVCRVLSQRELSDVVESEGSFEVAGYAGGFGLDIPFGKDIWRMIAMLRKK